MADKKPAEVTDTDIQKEVSRQARELMAKSKLNAKQKSDLRALVGYMTDGAPEEYDDFMLMYLSGDRDWKDDYKAIFGEAQKTGAKYDITGVQSIKIID